MALPKTRIRSYYERRTEADENDTRSKAPITITPNDNVALPESRIKSYYERSTEADENDIRLKTPITATPNDRIVMIVHAPDHDPISKANMFQEGMFDWSGKGNHVDYLPDETVELEQGELLGYGANR
jgi:hypothetical protein